MADFALNAKISCEFEPSEDPLKSGDELSKQLGSIAGHISDENLHHTAEQILEMFPTSLPAEGGNADTVGGKRPSDFMQFLQTADADYINNHRNNTSYCVAVDGNVSEQIGLPDKIWHTIVNYATPTTLSGFDFQVAYPISGGIKPGYKILYRKSSNTGFGSWYDITDGGNADTVDGKHADDLVQSNPNLLINPDFRINQRGAQKYTEKAKFACDRWRLTNNDGGIISIEQNGITFSASGSQVGILQTCEAHGDEYLGLTLTVSAKINGAVISVSGTIAEKSTKTIVLEYFDGGILGLVSFLDGSGNLCPRVQITNGGSSNLSIEWVKLELGSTATPFTPPDPTLEKFKCGVPNDTSEYGYTSLSFSLTDTDLEAGVTPLENGKIVFVYE